MRIFLLIFYSILLTGCRQSEMLENTSQSIPTPDPTNILLERVKKSISDDMKDPNSTQFRKIFISDIKNDEFDIVVCGEFNTKNGYSAYSGFNPFIYQENSPGNEQIGNLNITTTAQTAVNWYPKTDTDFKYGAHYLHVRCGILP